MTGATGFIGSAVLRCLLDPASPVPAAEVRALVRTHPSRSAPAPRLSWIQGDVTQPRSLRGLCEGADVLIHLASRITGSEDECAAVNVGGARALVEEAQASGVERIIHLSTAAVYGHGPHRGITVDEVAPAPVSSASRTRLQAERITAAAGSTVLRPGLVTGAGDRWVVPTLADLVEQLPALWKGGEGLSSMVDVADLARLIVRLAIMPNRPPARVFHASHPLPVRNRDLMTALDRLGVLPLPTADWPWEVCLDRLRQSSGRVSERQFALLADDNWQQSEDIWRLARLQEGPGPLARLSAAAPWYTSHLADRRAPRK
ncbi:NAD-dependent epimerase/dehydratase family protein [Streptomyces violascens]|nr:NAD(P)-dependent oxidoreductase [Streptomyces violascens]